MLKLAGMLVVVVLIAAIAVLVQRNVIRRRRADAARRARDARLQKAYEGRVKMDVQVTGENLTSPFMRGICVAINADRMLIDVGLPHQPDQWIGRKAHVYFQLSGRKGPEHYDFFSPIIRIAAYNDGYALEIKKPRQILNNQKRAFVRLQPSSELIEEVVLWYVPARSGSPGDMTYLREAFCAGDVQIQDISAGGVRVRLNNSDPVVKRFKAADIGVMRLVADNGEERGQLNLWLVCQLVIVRQEKGSPTSDISFKFRKWATDPGDGEDFAWFPTEKDGGVPPLAAWVMRRHLEIHRNVGAPR